MMKYLLILCCTTLLTSCLKDPEVTNDDGVQSESVKVGTAVVNAWGTDDPLSIGYNEQVSINYTQEFLGYPTRVNLQESFTAIGKDATSVEKQTIFAFAHRTNEIDADGNSKISTTTKYLPVHGRTDDVEPTAAETLLDSMAARAAGDIHAQASEIAIIGTFKVLALLSSCELDDEDKKACDAQKVQCSQRCYNLNVSQETVAPPAAVQARANCGGVPDCQINLKKVSFDIIMETKQGSTTQKTKVSRWVSIYQDAPYVSKLMENCYRGLVKIPNSSQRVLATLCDRVVDFRYSTSAYPASTNPVE
jgi:hypothetical protein